MALVTMLTAVLLLHCHAQKSSETNLLLQRGGDSSSSFTLSTGDSMKSINPFDMKGTDAKTRNLQAQQPSINENPLILGQ